MVGHGMVTYFFSGLSVTGMRETMQNLRKIRGGIVLCHILQCVTLMYVCVSCSLSHKFACVLQPDPLLHIPLAACPTTAHA